LPSGLARRRALYRPRVPRIGDVDDLKRLGPARIANRYFVAATRSEKCQRDGRVDANLAGGQVRLVHTDDRDGKRLIALICVGYGGAEKYAVALSLFGGIDNLCIGDAVYQEAKATVDLAQAALAFLVIGIFAAITVARGPGDDLHHAVAGRALCGQFGFQPLEAARGHVKSPSRPSGRPVVVVRFVVHRGSISGCGSSTKRLASGGWVPYPADMPDPAVSAEAELRRLLDIMAALRHPETGCPWDRTQTFDTIAPYTIEEAYEVADAIAQRDFSGLPDELGDLLFQVVYHARMAEEAGLFDFADVAKSISDKMIRRHPHVFGNAAARSSSAQTAAWEAQKSTERAAAKQPGALAGVPAALPALTRALKLTNRAARVGFDWPDAEQVLAKLDEEVHELRAELAGADPARLMDEVGDMLFVLANLARKLGLDPELCLRHANEKFYRRFNATEHDIERQGKALSEVSLAEMEAGWQRVKAAERG
jgi:ATP diphosphatase